ncbi:MAG: hypothetical protein AB7V53_06575 [Dongiaceae bacterium]
MTDPSLAAEGSIAAGAPRVTSVADPVLPPAPKTAEGPAAPGDWSQALDPDLRSLAEAKGWASPAEAVRSYQSLERLLGADKIALPGKEAGPEAWEPVWQKLGRPAKPEGYSFGPPAGATGYDEGLARWARGAFHKAGVPDRMAAALHDGFLEQQAALRQEAASAERLAQEELEAALARDWGPARDAKLAAARRAAETFAEEPATLDRLEQAIGAAAVLKLFARIGESMGEDRMLGAGNGAGRLTPADAEAEIRRVRGEAMKDPRHPLVDKTHPDHGRLVRELEALYSAAFPA